MVHNHNNSMIAEPAMFKSFAANYNALLVQSLSDERTISTTFLSFYFGNGPDVARCCIPFKSYARKLANNSAKVSVMYSRLDV